MTGGGSQAHWSRTCPLGAFLSGGIDSTIVVGLMAQLRRPRCAPSSIGFAATRATTRRATRGSRRSAFGTEHTEFMVGPQPIDLVERLVVAPRRAVRRLVRDPDLRRLASSTRAARHRGADRRRRRRALRRLPALLRGRARRARAGAAAAGSPRAGRGGCRDQPNPRAPSRRLARFVEAAALPLEDRMLRWIGFFAGRGRVAAAPGAARPTIDDR